MVLAVLSTHMNGHRQVIEQATEKINASTRAFQTDNPKSAFWYGVGKNGVWAAVGLMVVGMFGLFYSQSMVYQQKEALLAQYPNPQAYRFLMQNGQLVQQATGWTELILTLAPNPDDLIAGKHYRYNKKRHQVSVPLYYTDPKH